jgi:hypothetical protein
MELFEVCLEVKKQSRFDSEDKDAIEFEQLCVFTNGADANNLKKQLNRFKDHFFKSQVAFKKNEITSVVWVERIRELCQKVSRFKMKNNLFSDDVSVVVRPFVAHQRAIKL